MSSVENSQENTTVKERNRPSFVIYGRIYRVAQFFLAHGVDLLIFYVIVFNSARVCLLCLSMQKLEKRRCEIDNLITSCEYCVMMNLSSD